MNAPRRRTVLGAGGAALGAALLAACGTDTSDRYDTGYVAGDGVTTEIKPADRGDVIDVEGRTYDGKTWSSTALQGHVLVMNVWYASCPPCREEAPDLEKLHQKYAAQGAEFVGVNVRDAAGPAKAFEKKYGITYPSLPDKDAEVMYALRGQVSPNAVPSTLVLDTKGRVAARISGALDPSVLRAMIDQVLGE